MSMSIFEYSSLSLWMDFSKLCPINYKLLQVCALWHVCTLPKEVVQHACEPRVGVRFRIDGTVTIYEAKVYFQSYFCYKIWTLDFISFLDKLYCLWIVFPIENYKSIISFLSYS
jgi:hypothetical protein